MPRQKTFRISERFYIANTFSQENKELYDGVTLCRIDIIPSTPADPGNYQRASLLLNLVAASLLSVISESSQDLKKKKSLTEPMVSGGKVIPGQLYLHTFSCKYGYLEKKNWCYRLLTFTDLVLLTWVQQRKTYIFLLIIKVHLLAVSFIWYHNQSVSHHRDRTEN